MPPERLLFTGPFHGDQTARAREELGRRSAEEARDVLYVVANGTARRAAIADLVRRRGAVFGVRVVTLRGLPKEIERRARVRSPESAGGIVEELVIERAVRRAASGAFTDAPVGGLTARIASTIDALERAGAVPSVVARAVDVPDDGMRVLLDVWQSVDASRSVATRTTAASFAAATALLRSRGAGALAGCSLVVLEDLPLGHRVECELIDALVATASCAVIATNACAAQLAAAPAVRSLAALRAMGDWSEIACPSGSEAADDVFAGALHRLFTAGPTAAHETPAPRLRITRLEAVGDAGEVRLAARVVRRHLRATGDDACSPSDILLVTHTRGRYHALIGEIFGASGIPVALPRDRSAADSGIGSVLLELLELATAPSRATRDRALGLTRAPHLDVNADAADRLERTVRTRGYLTLEGWDDLALRTLGERSANRVNRLKRALAGAHARLVASASADDIARTVRALAKELRLVGNAFFARHRAARVAPEGGLVQARSDAGVREDNQAWEVIERVLDGTMSALLRVDPANATLRGIPLAERWLALFRRAIADQPAGTDRPTADAVRVVGTVAGDGQPAKVTIVLGLLEKSFPRQPRQDPFVRDDVRRRLAETSGIVLPTTEDAAERERECFVRAVATARRSLYLSYAATDEAGKPSVPSFFVEDLQRAVGGAHRFAVERLGVADVTPAIGDAGSRAELLAAVAHDVWQRLPRTSAGADRTAAAFTTWNALIARSDAGRRAMPIVSGRVPTTRPVFDPELFALAPHTTLELSASQLKSLGHCTYKHFVEKVLAPATLDAPAYDALQKGTLVHDAMMAWVGMNGWARGESALPELDAWVARRIAEYPPAVSESPVTRFRLEEDRARLLDFLRGELAAMAAPGAFRPRYNELAFGSRSIDRGERDAASIHDTFALPVATSAGERVVRFTGSVDRLDTVDVGTHTLGVAVDYKTGKSSKHYAKAMLDGTDLQLRLYLLAVQRLWGITPVGALYIGFGDGVRRGAVRADVAERVGGIDPKCVRLMEPEEWDAFVHVETPRLVEPLIDRLVRLDIVARPRDGDCGFCDFGPICRYDRNTPEVAHD
jgi:hypothetical protein